MLYEKKDIIETELFSQFLKGLFFKFCVADMKLQQAINLNIVAM